LVSKKLKVLILNTWYFVLKNNGRKRIKALVTLLDDSDMEVVSHVEEKIRSLGDSIIPYLEQEWESNLNPNMQKKLENLIHSLQFEQLKARLLSWKLTNSSDLLEGLWILATYQYPDLSLEKLRNDIEQIYYDCWVALKPDLRPFDQVRIINSVLFDKLHFSANAKNFHSPSNSMINVVLETKKGNPISLCCVYMLIAQKLKLPVYGVNLPNLFILTYKTDDGQFYINAFNRGVIFTKEDIDNYLDQLNLSHHDIFYQPAENIDILKRILRNLTVAFQKLGEKQQVGEISQLLDTILDGQE
jgi:regulator of sirC expression with transglutaminase-like and TPR domain